MFFIRICVAGAFVLWGAHNSIGWSARAEQASAAVTEGLLVRARKAVGADRLRVTSLSAKGTVYSGFNGVTGQPLERAATLYVKVQCPDFYVRVQEDGRKRRRIGFARLEPILSIAPLREETQVGVTPPDDPAEFIDLQRHAIGLFLLGALADTCGMFKTTVIVPPSDKPQDVEVLQTRTRGPVSIDFDRQSGFPLRVRYVDEVFMPKPISPADRKQGRLSEVQRITTEVVLSFDDRRAVGGIRFPHKFLKTANGIRLEQISFDEVLINPALSLDEFVR